jgi:CYTH domain-containing protein
MAQAGGHTVLKLTQKLPDPDGHGRQGALTTIYLSDAEYAALAVMPAATLSKSRLTIAPYGVDVFAGHLEGLVLAEVEFDTAADAAALRPAAFCHAEVTADRRFTGGELVRATRAQVAAWTAEYGIELPRR